MKIAEDLKAGKMLNRLEVCELVGVSSATIRRMELAGQFPLRHRLSPRRVGWALDEVLAWRDDNRGGVADCPCLPVADKVQ